VLAEREETPRGTGRPRLRASAAAE